MVATPTPSLPPSAALSGIEHRIQTWNNCGPATLSMALSYFDLYYPQTQIAEEIKPDPEDRNVTPEEMAAFVSSETELKALSRVNGRLQTIRQLLSAGIPVIVEYGLQPENEYRWLDWLGHYLLVTAYDDEQQSVWVYDSWPRTGEIPDENFVFEPIEISYEELDRNWRAFNRTYIAIYKPEEANRVAAIVGEDLDDDTMWQNALTFVQDELQAEPDNAFLWFNLGSVFNARLDYDRAAAAFDQARAIGLPWRMLWYQFGPYEAYYQTARYDDVILLADITLKDRPYFEEAYYYKALAQLELGQAGEARANLQKALDFNPNFTRAKTSLEALNQASS
jgi:tetratricopeptide (TPR) repeat protein